MPVYDRPKAGADGRGLSRRITGIERSLASSRRLSVGDVPDPTPPPDPVDPGSLTVLLVSPEEPL
jgi:hypothetical protein